jgi:uncharacterized protein (TIGR03435 family)
MPRLKFMATIAFFGVALACASQVSLAQPPAGRREFDVASVKPNRDASGSALLRTPGGLTATDYAFDGLLEMAYQTHQIDTSRVPNSVRAQRYDIIAKATGKISGDQYWEMLQALLENRFNLKSHRETKDVLVYALVLAKSGIDAGPNLSRSLDADCPVNPNGSDFCGLSSRAGAMVGQRISMARIARELAHFAGRPVQDETGLTGSFDLHLTWAPDQFASKGDGDRLSGGDKVNAAGNSVFDAPGLFAAIQEQLGLKLESKKGKVEILVIDRAEQPSEN